MTPSLRSFRRRSVGRKITAIGRVGKRIVLDLDAGDRIVIEPRMSGLVSLVNSRDRRPAARPGTRQPEEAVVVLGPARIGCGATGLAAGVRDALRCR